MQDDNFLEYPMAEQGISISRPAAWKVVPASLPASDSNPEEYSQYLPIAEKMLKSFQFLV
jgi:hypothetical protein